MADAHDSLAPPVGMKEIAAKAGVSIATVSMSLAGYPQVSERTRQRIRLISRQLGYKPPRRRVRQGQTRSRSPSRIGYFLLGSGMQTEVNQTILHRLTAAASRQEMRLELLCVEDVERIETERPRLLQHAAGVDGVILTGHVDAQLLGELEQRRIPHVLLGSVWGDPRAMPGPHGQIITPDAVAMGELATATLIAEGHRRIGFFCGRMPRGLWNHRWYLGHHHALIDAGLPFDPALVHVTHAAHAAGNLAADAFNALDDPPTAYVCPSMDTVPEFLAAMQLAGREIDPRAIIAGGHDPSALTRFRTVGSDIGQITQLLIHQICQLHRQPLPCPTQLLLPFRLFDPDRP